MQVFESLHDIIKCHDISNDNDNILQVQGLGKVDPLSRIPMSSDKLVVRDLLLHRHRGEEAKESFFHHSTNLLLL